MGHQQCRALYIGKLGQKGQRPCGEIQVRLTSMRASVPAEQELGLPRRSQDVELLALKLSQVALS